MPQHQDITIFSIDDDDAPLAGYGEVDVDGNITESTFSTDPEHARPYLKRVLDLGESLVDFLAGGSVIGQLTFEVVDFPTDVEDQNTGLFTSLLASATSQDNQLLGVRIVFRQQNAAGAYENIFDGVCGPITMPKLSTFRVQMRDVRERERKLKLFNIATSTCIFPVVGPKEGWGHQTEYDPVDGYVTVGDPVFPRIQGVLCQYRDILPIGGGTLATNGGFVLAHSLGDDDAYRELLLKFGTGSVAFYQENLAGVPAWRYDDVLIEWSATGAPGTYHSVGPMLVAGIFAVGNNVFNIKRERINGVDAYYVKQILLNTSLEELYAGDKPADGAFVYVRVVSNREPSDEVPYFLEDRFGSVLKKSYDGDYTKPGTVVPVRYNVARMDFMIGNTPVALARITAPVDDGREWLQQNVYRPSSYAPSIRNGEVYPLKYELPDEDEPLTQLDDSNTVSADWGHGPDNVINQVIVEYEREIVPTTLPMFAKPRTQKVIIERNRLTDNSQRRHGTQAQTFKPVTLRSVVSESDAFERTPQQEVGGLISARLGEELLRRYTNGAQVVEAVCQRTVAVNALQEGDWVIGAWSWLADYVTHERGMNRLLQIVKVRRSAPHLRSFLLVDAGPHDQPIEQPTVGVLVENSDGSVTIPITDIPVGGRAEVQYALGEEQPEANSGQWRLVGYLDEDGETRTIPYLWPGRLVWVRARGTQRGRRASAWTAPVSIRLDDVALLRTFTLDFITDPDSADYGKPRVTWDSLTGTEGVRVKYHVHAPHSEQAELADLTDEIDFDVDDGSGIIPVVLRQWEQITVQLVGYPAFAAGAVAGTPGSASAARTVARVERHYVKPSVGEIVERTEDFTGLLTLEILDQQLTITNIFFRTRTGSTSDWSAFVEDVAAPYGASVGIVPGATSAIGYEVYAYDHAGVERLFKSGTVEFPFEGLPSLLIRATEVSGPDTQDFMYVEIAVADPVPQGLDSITLTAVIAAGDVPSIDPAALLTIGVGTGTPTNDLDTTDVVLVTIERPPPGSPTGNGTVIFHAEADGRTAVETTVDVDVEAGTPVVFGSLSITRNDSLNDILDFNFSVVSGSYDHFGVFVKATGYDLDYRGLATNVDSLDSNSDYGWNLVRPPDIAGTGERHIQFYVVGYDASGDILGTSDDSGVFDFQAYDDT